MKTAIALGTFDGVHLGHKAVLDLPNDCRKTAVIFGAPPKAILSGAPTAIMTEEDKISALRALGINDIFPLDFLQVRHMPPKEFLQFLKDKFSPSFISCGFNYHFGKNAAGDTEQLGDFCRQNGITLRCCPPVCVDGEPISSTRIRQYLRDGEIERANALLTVPFSFTAEVITGDRRGRTIGFPTMNQKYPTELVPLKFGVYQSRVRVDDREYEGITDIGVRPTFRTDYIISETYIKDFSGDLYGRRVTLLPERYLRGEMRFSSVEELKRQIQTDINS